MALLDLMADDTSAMNEYSLHLWEDLLPSLKTLDYEYLELERTEINLFETSIRSYLLRRNIPTEYIYPIYRLNGYENSWEILRTDKVLKLPTIEDLENLYSGLFATISL